MNWHFCDRGVLKTLECDGIQIPFNRVQLWTNEDGSQVVTLFENNTVHCIFDGEKAEKIYHLADAARTAGNSVSRCFEFISYSNEEINLFSNQ